MGSDPGDDLSPGSDPHTRRDSRLRKLLAPLPRERLIIAISRRSLSQKAADTNDIPRKAQLDTILHQSARWLERIA